MILARALRADRRSDLELAFDRMALPSAAREYLLEKVPLMQVLLTGLGRDEGRFLKEKMEGQEQPGREEFPQYVAGDVRHRPGAGLLTGRRDQVERLRGEAKRAGLAELARALGEVLEAPEVPAPLEVGGKVLRFDGGPLLMGVLNVTPDSFSDGGAFLDPERAIAHGQALVAEGAALLDVGGESTRPGAAPVTAQEERGRVLPVIRALVKDGVLVSVDTRKPEVARAALEAGASLVNDVAGFQDEAMARVVADSKAACCLMHMQGTPETMQRHPHYGDVVEEVLDFLRAAVARATQAGVPREKILIDPGIGFGKTLEHNLVLLRRLEDLRLLGLPLLVGTSRKAFLGHLTGGKPASERLHATLGSVAAMTVLGGADVVRVHDVAEARDALLVANAVRHARGGGDLYEKPPPGAPKGPLHVHG